VASTPIWDPAQYGRFGDERGRPFFELVGRVGAERPRLVVDLGCGTGALTATLADRWPAAGIEGIDSSPEMIELARSRVGDTAATFVNADVFAWQPDKRYDCVFFGFWLSHVPPQSFGAFWDLLRPCLASGGRVLFVDEGAPRESREPAAAASPIVKRRLRNGTVHEIVKIFYEPDELLGNLADVAWAADIELTSEGLLIGTARPEKARAD